MSKTRIVLCIGKTCNAAGVGDACFARLREVLGYPNPFTDSAIKWEIANCLSRCDDGPNLVIYPEGRWIHDLDLAQLEAVISTEILPKL